MYPKFHLQLAHETWAKLVQAGDTVVDATCGNGHDARILAALALGRNQGRLILFDRQEQALQKSLQNLHDMPLEQIEAHNLCHSKMDTVIAPHSCKLIVFNLGYLPGGDKSYTTHGDTTLQAIKAAMGCLQPKGTISITCYPGHPAGKIEEEQVVAFCQGLDLQEWSVSSHRIINRQNHPHLLFVCHNKKP